MDNTEIKAIVKDVLNGAMQVTQGRTTYLRALVSGVQEALGHKHKQDANVQLAAVNATHVQFYEIVMETADGYVPPGTKDRGTELHRLATFARTSTTALRNHVRAGGDITTLKADTIIRSKLKVRDAPTREATPRRLKGSAERQTTRLLETLAELAKTDKASALRELNAVLDLVQDRLAKLGGTKTNGRTPRMVPRHVETSHAAH